MVEAVAVEEPVLLVLLVDKMLVGQVALPPLKVLIQETV